MTRAPGRAVDPFSRVLAAFDDRARRLTETGVDEDESQAIEVLTASIERMGARLVHADALDRDGRIPTEITTAIAELGCFGISAPTGEGGAGLSMKAAAAVMEALGAIDASVAVTVGTHTGIGMRGLVLYGSSQLQRRHLPALARGEQLACFALTEPGAGSDYAALRTTAVADGEGLRLNGTKVLVTNGGIADVATVTVRTPGLAGAKNGHSMLLVPLRQEGVRRGKEENKLGLRASSTCALHFEDVRVDMDHIIGRPNCGLEQVNHVLAYGRSMLAAGCVGLSRAATARALEQVRERRQFGRPIAEFDGVRATIAAMLARLHAMACLVRLVTDLEGEDACSTRWESAVAKVYCSESAWRTCDDTVQLFGGAGYVEEVGVARSLRDCRVARIFEGTNDVLRNHLAAAALGWETDSRVRLATLVDPGLAAHAQTFDALWGRLTEVGAALAAEHGVRAPRRQQALGRIAEASIALYTMLAVIARAHGELSVGCPGASQDTRSLTVTRLASVAAAALAPTAGEADELERRVADEAYRCADEGLRPW